MELISKSVALNINTDEGISLLKEAGINIDDFSFVPFVGFTLPEVGWHLNKENKTFFKMKNPKLAYWFAYFVGEVYKYNPFVDKRKGIFHRVLLVKKNDQFNKNLRCGNLSSSNIDFSITN